MGSGADVLMGEHSRGLMAAPGARWPSPPMPSGRGTTSDQKFPDWEASAFPKSAARSLARLCGLRRVVIVRAPSAREGRAVFEYQA